ncbi:MAG: VOC family protein [Gammaproteobacteria bacterium]|nr:VOC family protein [Pseudomonadales bacterium]MCP5348130.1 VOC family protein [Pseudomonadales bacterium]
MTGNPINWFEIYVQDTAKARAFYEGVLQIKLERLENPGLEMWAFPQDSQQYGSSGALVSYPEKSSGINSTIVYFHCADCAIEAARVAEFGGKVEREKMSIGQYGFIALALDPDGNMIGLHSTQ